MQYHFSRSTVIAACLAGLTTLPAQAALGTRPVADAPKAIKPVARTSSDVARTVRWSLASGDNRGAPVIVVDKRRARVHVFEPKGRLVGSSPVVLGLAKGDHTVPGIGDTPLSQIKVEERTTPAGRFVAEPGRNAKGEDIVWVDYDAAVSMHRVRAVNPTERRLERLASPTPADNRISYGCINVPVAFYERVLSPAAHRDAVIYVLPETQSAASLFGFGQTVGKSAAAPSGKPAVTTAGTGAGSSATRIKASTKASPSQRPSQATWQVHLLDGA